MDGGEAGEAERLAEAQHVECGAGIVFSRRRDAVVAGDVVEVVMGNKNFRDFSEGCDLGARIAFPFALGAAVAVFGAEAFESGLFAGP